MEQLAFSDVTDLCQFMQQRLSYTNQQQRKQAALNGFWWKTPSETLRDGHGFCYDLAAFALHHLPSSLLPQAKLLLVVWGDFGNQSNAGHFVCTFKIQKSFYSIGNGRLKGPFTFSALLQSASRSNQVIVYKWLLLRDISYHISYKEMAKFICD
ncbi:hypothetical protein [Agarivorans sp. JK6]|uniref:hypothetical protein n=1 Tax=Agarivorans sp. JK6 TaxID=2997426 RepID=UPI003872E584